MTTETLQEAPSPRGQLLSGGLVDWGAAARSPHSARPHILERGHNLHTRCQHVFKNSGSACKAKISRKVCNTLLTITGFMTVCPAVDPGIEQH